MIGDFFQTAVNYINAAVGRNQEYEVQFQDSTMQAVGWCGNAVGNAVSRIP